MIAHLPRFRRLDAEETLDTLFQLCALGHVLPLLLPQRRDLGEKEVRGKRCGERHFDFQLPGINLPWVEVRNRIVTVRRSEDLLLSILVVVRGLLEGNMDNSFHGGSLFC
jgi:hypothetical protein